MRAWACPPPPRPAAPPHSLTRLDQLYPPLARSFLHACNPPIIHGNLTSDTIFIQHNGLIKIGSGADGWGSVGGGAGDLREPRAEDTLHPIALTSALSLLWPCSVAPHLLQWCVGVLGDGGRGEGSVGSCPALPVALPVDLRSPIRAEREEPRNLHFFPPEYSRESQSAPLPRAAPAPPLPELPSLFQRLPMALLWTSSPLGCVRWRY